MSGNKEYIMNEKRFTTTHNVRIVTSYSRLFRPKDYPTFDALKADIQLEWDSLWEQIVTPTAAAPQRHNATIEQEKEQEKEKENEKEKDKKSEKTPKKSPAVSGTGTNNIPYVPPCVPKPGIRLSMHQVRFLPYSAVVWYLLYSFVSSYF
eukprot:TRINITY_DN4432_c1_g1_i2.p2 TRINITY_DN4432_c1_g1~~TRINITY_DN4432_c1_g1_i2.p2  ORF type:complete len:150 (+),score=42.33 TRINITY_DN4432_c1_g1_i2:924-1373(+)